MKDVGGRLKEGNCLAFFKGTKMVPLEKDVHISTYFENSFNLIMIEKRHFFLPMAPS
jgi:hypothetical protein